MNSLEFIEKIIKNLKEILQGIDNRIQDDQNYPTLLAYDIGEKEHFEKELAHFEQIKFELEAWEEIKKYIIVEEGHLALYDSIYEYIELENGCIDESNSEEEGISIMVIKKALEVKDEKV